MSANLEPQEHPPLTLMQHPSQVLRWAVDHVPRLAVTTSLGPQTLVVLDVLHHLGVEVPVFLLDTGLLYDETLWLKGQVEARYGYEVRTIRPALSLEAQGERLGERLWERDPDRCCHVRKVLPLHRALDGLDGWITGLRADQASSRADTRPVEWDDVHGMLKINPLWRWSRSQVFRYLRAHELPYNPLLDQGFRSVGCQPCSRAAPVDADPADERAGRWQDHAKTECGIHFLFPVATEESP